MSKKIRIGVELSFSKTSMNLEADLRETPADLVARALQSFAADYQMAQCEVICDKKLEMGKTLEEQGIEDGAMLSISIPF